MDLEEVASLIEAGRWEDALDGLRAHIEHLGTASSAVFIGAGQSAAEWLASADVATIAFNVVNERAVRQMQANQLKLVREFTDAQRDATRLVLTDGVTRGISPIQQARNLRASVGLTARQAQAVINYRRLLEEGSSEALTRQLRDRRYDRTVARAARGGDPLTPAQVQTMVDRYEARYVQYRSKVIARSEALRSVHQGTEEAYNQAIDAGHITAASLQRKWVTARDERVRHSHRRLNGMVRGWGDTWPGDDGPLRYPGDPDAPASETVQCRCVIATRIGPTA
jgi:hypothetical protein